MFLLLVHRERQFGDRETVVPVLRSKLLLEMIYRVAQVLYTAASSLNPQAPVFLSIEGKPLNNDYPLGGEGLILEYPLTRQQFKQDFLAE